MNDKKDPKSESKPEEKPEPLATIYTKGRKPEKITQAEAAKRLKAAAKIDKPSGKGQSER